VIAHADGVIDGSLAQKWHHGRFFSSRRISTGMTGSRCVLARCGSGVRRPSLFAAEGGCEWAAPVKRGGARPPATGKQRPG
jgi:hypothetical protein